MCVTLVLEQLLDVQVLVEGEVDGAAVELVAVLGGLGHRASSWTTIRVTREANAAPCQACRAASRLMPQVQCEGMLQAMFSGRELHPTYPYWLAGEPAAPNH